jgi:hypothetical protein
LYDKNINSDDSGVCKDKQDNTLKCEDAVRPSQCTFSDVPHLKNNCFWIYNESTGTGGECYSKTNESLECSFVKRKNQCINDNLIETFLKDKCTYDDDKEECKLICEKITREAECGGGEGKGRRDDCVWIYSNIDKNVNEGSCYSKSITGIICEEVVRKEQCDCFWLSDGIDGESGVCVSVDDEDLGCKDAKRSEECIARTDINVFGEKCFWLEGNPSRTENYYSRCENEV